MMTEIIERPLPPNHHVLNLEDRSENKMNIFQMEDEKDETQPTSVATLIPKHDVTLMQKQTSVYSHGEMTRSLSQPDLYTSGVSSPEKTTFLKVVDFKNRMDERMSQRGCYLSNWVSLVLPLVMVIFGAVFLHKCTVQPEIPIFLVVAGVSIAIEIFFKIIRNAVKKSKMCEAFMESKSSRPHPLRILNFCFLFIWFIVGSVWVYRIHWPKEDECDWTLYKFTFWLITLTYIISGMLLFCGCGLFLYTNKVVLK